MQQDYDIQSPRRQWFLSEASTKVGHILAEAILAKGDRVIGCVRTPAQSDTFDALAPGRAIGRIVNYSDPESINIVVASVEHTLGPIDVMVNGYCNRHTGTFEESGLEDLRCQFEGTVFRTVSVIRAVLPFMRARRRGRIINLTSVGGLVSQPGWAFYNASKFALEGITEALGKEVRSLGIHVTAVAPGSFQVASPLPPTQSPRYVPDYETILGGAGVDLSPSDPAKLAQAILKVADSPVPPAHLILGSDALALVRGKLNAMAMELQQWEATSLSTAVV